jgi:hypothetical protein
MTASWIGIQMPGILFRKRHCNTIPRFMAATIVLWIFGAVVRSAAPDDAENLFRKGVLSSGTSLTGNRESGGSVTGAPAACMNCHRRSGLGGAEGRILIPPITAKYLLQPGPRAAPNSMSAGETPGVPSRPAYTQATLAQAIRAGTDSSGRTLNYLMPRYDLAPAEMGSLIAYLDGLSAGKVPGVTADTLHFAAIVAPDADPAKRKGMLDVLNHYAASMNELYQAKSPPLSSAQQPDFNFARKWKLHVWELAGIPSTWEEQLRTHLRAEPVFAAVSGVGNKEWSPVHKFCEAESIPCLFPNVDLPVDAEDDFYNIYFSKGVLLEAQMMARRIVEISGHSPIRRVTQVYREGDIGAPAGKVLRDEISAHGITVTNRIINSGAAEGGLAAAIQKADAEDALILWLRPADVRSLPAMPPKISNVFLSGLMGGLEKSPLGGAWRKKTQIAYPVELPYKRSYFLNYPLVWFQTRHIPVVEERTQVDTYTACGILSDSLNGMWDDFVRDYLIETIESMLSARTINGYYTRLGLAPGQRFASKGGYMVRLDDADSARLVPVGDWIVP